MSQYRWEIRLQDTAVGRVNLVGALRPSVRSVWETASYVLDWYNES